MNAAKRTVLKTIYFWVMDEGDISDLTPYNDIEDAMRDIHSDVSIDEISDVRVYTYELKETGTIKSSYVPNKKEAK